MQNQAKVAEISCLSNGATSALTGERRQYFWRAGCILLATALTLFAPGAVAQPADQQSMAPLFEGDAKTRIKDSYIVVFRTNEAADPKASAHIGSEGKDAAMVKRALEQSKALQVQLKRMGVTVVHTYTAALVGFSAILDARQLEFVRAQPGVAYVEADAMATGSVIQNNPPAGLDRIDRRLTPLNATFTYTQTGAGVHVYVLDSGLRGTHTEFAGRVGAGRNFIAGAGGTIDPNATGDCHGHGTHVAGTAGGSTFGVAKGVIIHPVRVLGCGNTGPWTGIIAGIDWVRANAAAPAIANLSLGSGLNGTLAAADTAVTNLIGAGITAVIAAMNNNGDACTVSPARVANAITVGSTLPATDQRAATSNFGACLDLFAPGDSILSAGIANDNATATFSGTSMATPLVTGAAAQFLETNPASTPAQIRAAIMAAANTAATPGWGGVGGAGAGSPNVLLHWGSLNNGQTDGDPHIRTVDGRAYDFHGAGEFVLLTDKAGFEVQSRHSPVNTGANRVTDPNSGLPSCVSINTAVAARIGKSRVTYQPDERSPNSGGPMVVRIDGKPVTLSAQGIPVSGGYVMPHAAGLDVTFPGGGRMLVTQNFWSAYNRWYLNISVLNTHASEGIMGHTASGSWLPSLPDGTSMGPLPAALAQRHVDLNEKFASAWRVTGNTSLFDYAAGQSDKSYADPSWPSQTGGCTVKDTKQVLTAIPGLARRACRGLADSHNARNCAVDVTATGEAGFAKAYLMSESLARTSTQVRLAFEAASPNMKEPVLTAQVSYLLPAPLKAKRLPPSGIVEFYADGELVERGVPLDRLGLARVAAIKPLLGARQIWAIFRPADPRFQSSSVSAPIGLKSEIR